MVAGLAAFTGIASAHHAEVVASAACGGHISFTSTAWNGSTEASRTNPKIEISYSVNSGSTFTKLAQKAAYQFNKANNYQFTDSFDLAAPLPSSVIVKAQAIANWANGVSVAIPARRTRKPSPTVRRLRSAMWSAARAAPPSP